MNPSGNFFGVGAVAGGASAIVAGSDGTGNPVAFAVRSADGQVYAAPLNATGDPTGPFALTTPGPVKKVVVA